MSVPPMGKERPYRHLLSAAANGDHDPQLLGVISEFEKASHVAKLRGARERKKRATSKCEGRKSVAEGVPVLSRWPGSWAPAGRSGRSQPSWPSSAISQDQASRSSRQSWRGCCAVNCERPAKWLGAESRPGIE